MFIATKHGAVNGFVQRLRHFNVEVGQFRNVDGSAANNVAYEPTIQSKLLCITDKLNPEQLCARFFTIKKDFLFVCTRLSLCFVGYWGAVCFEQLLRPTGWLDHCIAC